jgi:DTW domain-containing protein YfiP
LRFRSCPHRVRVCCFRTAERASWLRSSRTSGPWGQASKLYRENGWLAALPHYALSPSEPSRYRIRREPRPNFISTIEAVVAALRILEPATEGLDALLTAFDEMIDAQVVYAHRAPRRPERKIRRRARGVLDPGDT